MIKYVRTHVQRLVESWTPHMIQITCNEHSKSFKSSPENEFQFNRIQRGEGVFPLMEQLIWESPSFTALFFHHGIPLNRLRHQIRCIASLFSEKYSFLRSLKQWKMKTKDGGRLCSCFRDELWCLQLTISRWKMVIFRISSANLY